MSDAPRPDEAVVQEVLAANEAFYAAVETGDLDALRAVWTDAADSVCVHPGAAPIHGTAAVLRSWALVMASTDYIQFFLTDVEVTVARDAAVVTCAENILTDAGGQADAPFRGGRARAVNVFTRVDGRWRVWLHQASPVGSDLL
ncbi:MAG TPA: nuclear transport factor 2 family protein [Marmoricola sp.]|nr:nuclear transport factor 2 family protein [Marmoricola sp.]